MQNKSLAIASASGSFKGVFTHGVLTALESAGIRADGYAAASSSAIPTAWAAIGKVAELGVNYWLTGMQELQKPNMGMSQVSMGGIKFFNPPLDKLLAPETPEYLVATSAVVTPEAASQTQSEKARRLGRKLLISAAKKDRSWVDDNLQLVLFSTRKHDLKIDQNNFDEIAYATSRMLHAWDIPAWIKGKPYIDASYTCLCPAIEMIDAGYKEVIAISNEPGILDRDMFGKMAIPASYQGISIHIIKPDTDPKEMGVDFTNATPDGLLHVYKHGQEKGQEFLTNCYK
ncbi:MAG: hypothetical protein AAF915_21790 [Cyanobacteria bacterium P01_D01_bin.50]